jgi:NAD(P)H-dependent FMN reductase
MEPNGKQDGIRIAVVLGSVRPGNYTAKAAALVVDELRKHPRVAAEVLDPAQYDLPLPGTAPEHAGASLLREKVASAAAVVLATPEYHGSFSSITKLVIENLGFPSVLSGKPVALLGVAAGSIGAIKSLEHLRGVVSHIGGLALPLPISVPNVQRVFDREGNCLDPAVEKLVRGLGTTLLRYLEHNVCPRITLERLLREGVAPAIQAL